MGSTILGPIRTTEPLPSAMVSLLCAPSCITLKQGASSQPFHGLNTVWLCDHTLTLMPHALLFDVSALVRGELGEGRRDCGQAS